MKIRAVSAASSIVVLAVLFGFAVGEIGRGQVNAASGSAPVTITNTPVPITGTVALVPSQPFAAAGAGVTQDTLFAADKFPVPVAKRLIVETISLHADVPPGDIASCGVTSDPATANPVSYRFVMTPQGNFGGFDTFTSTPSVRFYFGPGEELTWFCFRNGSGFITFTWSISGYLVDVS